jgi:ferredoxin--NADP+ reductase
MIISRVSCPLNPAGIPNGDELQHLRDEHYNATLEGVIAVHEDLCILRVVPDAGLPAFAAGQYLSLGLGNWEPRVAGVDEEPMDPLHVRKLAKRAYSISCSILDAGGRLLRVREFPYLEFYVALVRHAEKRPPALTPRLFALGAGDRLFVERHSAGHYLLDPVQPDDDVVFFATGTGEAPHNAMIAELLSRGHRGRIASAVSVRLLKDAAYRTIHQTLAECYANYKYVVLTTREPANLDATLHDYVGKRYLQQLVETGELERETGVRLNPAKAHAFLCGSPVMIGAPRHAALSQQTALPGSMLDLLLRRGFRPDEPQRPGNIHFERYW